MSQVPTIYPHPHDVVPWTPLQLTMLVTHVTDLLEVAAAGTFTDPGARAALQRMLDTVRGRLDATDEAGDQYPFMFGPNGSRSPRLWDGEG